MIAKVDVIGKVLSEPWRVHALALMNEISEDAAEDALLRLRDDGATTPAERVTAEGARRVHRPGLRMREAILRRDGYRCQLCGASPKNDPQVVLEVDHKYPVAFGGSNRAINLQALCRPCNRKKGFDWEELDS